MEKKLENFNINFKTKDIPAPFAHTISLEGKYKKTGLEIELNIKYIGREELEEEEIFEEGFTLEDDFNWKGELSSVWYTEIMELIDKGNLSSSKEDTDPTEEIIVSLNFSEEKNKEIINNKKWIYFLQEIIQAIFEVSGKELPLEIVILNISKDKVQNLLFLTFYFSAREVNLKLLNSSNEELLIKNEWNSFQDFLKHLYTPEFIPEKAIFDVPKAQGTYIDPGEGVWFKLGEGIINPGKTEVILPLRERVNTIVEKYFSYKITF